jgi:hypothetical protein
MKKGRAADLGLLLERGDVGEEVLYVLPTEVQVRHRWMRIGDKGGEKVRIAFLRLTENYAGHRGAGLGARWCPLIVLVGKAAPEVAKNHLALHV